MTPRIARPSAASLFLHVLVKGQPVSSATGFVVRRTGKAYLITNRHVVAGRDTLLVRHNAPQLGSYQDTYEPLRDTDGTVRWLEHPDFGRAVDVVALPLTHADPERVALHEHDIEAPLDVATRVADPVSIIGFPFGLTVGFSLPVWVRGTLASEPDFDYGDLPVFLIDARTRQGQSGSPVLFYSNGGQIPMNDGSVRLFTGPVERLVGVYSGRIVAAGGEVTDLGSVWKRRVIAEIIDGGVRGDES